MKKKQIFLIVFIIFSINTYSQNRNTCLCSNLKDIPKNDSLVKKLGQKIETAFFNEDNSTFNNSLNKQAFSEQIIKYSKIDTSKNDYEKGFINGLINSSENISKKIADEIANGAYYNFISYEYNIIEKSYYLTFRFYSSEAGINYHDYRVCSDNKTVMFNDIYIYLTGEHLSETYARLYRMSKPKNNILSRERNETSKDFQLLIESTNLRNQGKFEESYNKLNEMTSPLATEKFVLILKSITAASFDDKIYLNSLQKITEAYPNDPTLYLKQIDYYLLKEDYTKTVELINKLEFETEDDFLNLLRGNALLIAEDYKGAEECYYFMVNNYVNLLEGFIG